MIEARPPLAPVAMHYFILVSLVLALEGVAVARAAPPNGFDVTNDKFEPTVTVSGPSVDMAVDDAERLTISFRSFVDKSSHAVSHQLYVQTLYRSGGWHYYEQAFDDKAVAHEVVDIDRHVYECGLNPLVGACEYGETIGIHMADSQVRSCANDGVEFKIKAKDGSSIIVPIKSELCTQELAALKPYVPAGTYQVDSAVLPPAYIGANLDDEGVFNRSLYSHLKQGLHVGKVTPGSPLDVAGVHRYDWLWELNGVALIRNKDLATAMQGVHSDSTVAAKVLSGGTIRDVTLHF